MERRWEVVGDAEEMPSGADGERWRYILRSDSEERDVIVELSGTVAATEPATLPSPLDEAARTKGRSVVEAGATRIEPAARILVHSTNLIIVPREGAYEPGDWVVVKEAGRWVEAVFLRPGDPDDGVMVTDPRAERGEYPRDVGWVRRADDDEIKAYRYEEIRAASPTGG
jgi:hypothetical protein